jgi:hypothetical protein
VKVRKFAALRQVAGSPFDSRLSIVKRGARLQGASRSAGTLHLHLKG